MNILTRKREFLQSFECAVPEKLRHLFSFGYDALVAQDIRSTRANARRTRYRWATAKSKMGRLLGNERMLSVFTTLLTRLSLVSGGDCVAVDFSDFGDGRQVLMFARQTRKGRALPLYFEILEYPIEQNSQNTFIIETITRFFVAVGCTPTLVFDRGFACPSLVSFLVQHKHSFIIRIKRRKHLKNAGGISRAAEEYEQNDVLASAWGCDLRLIRSDDPKSGNDPWYFVTNDTTSTRKEIITRYYHRFEIEEFFRDAKRIVGFEYLRFKTAHSLAVALWFAIITCWLFESVAEKLTEAQERERKLWRLSRFRYVYEALLRDTLYAAISAAHSPPVAV